MRDETDWHARMCAAREDLDFIADVLRVRADAMHMVGNAAFARVLHDIADRAFAAARNLHSATGDCIAEQLRSSERATANMVVGMVSALTVSAQAPASGVSTDD